MNYLKEGWKFSNDEKTNICPDIAVDSIRTLEIQEMQEEEKYIQALRNQREKVEMFRNEVEKKDLKIRELEKTIKEFKYNPEKIKEIENENKYLTEELNDKVREIYDKRLENK